MIGQSRSNVFWNISRTLIKVFYSNGPVNHISVWSTWLCRPSHISAVTDHVTCSGQWDFSKCEASRSLKTAPALEFVFPCCLLVLLASCERSLDQSWEGEAKGRERSSYSWPNWGPRAQLTLCGGRNELSQLSPAQMVHIQMKELIIYHFYVKLLIWWGGDLLLSNRWLTQGPQERSLEELERTGLLSQELIKELQIL